MTLIPFILISCILNILSWYFYRQYLKRLEKQLILFNFMTYIDSEKERLKILATLIDKLLFRYKFDL